MEKSKPKWIGSCIESIKKQVSLKNMLSLFIIFSAVFLFYVIIQVSLEVTNSAKFSMNLTTRTMYTIVQALDFSNYAQAILIYISILLGFSAILFLEIFKEIKTIGLFKENYRSRFLDLFAPNRIVLILYMCVLFAMPFISILDVFNALSNYAGFSSYGPHTLLLTSSFCTTYLGPNALNATIGIYPNGTEKILFNSLNNKTILSCKLLDATVTNTSAAFRLAAYYSIYVFLAVLFYVALKLDVFSGKNKPKEPPEQLSPSLTSPPQTSI